MKKNEMQKYAADAASRIVYPEDNNNGFYLLEDFYKQAAALLEPLEGCFLVAVDIDHFKDINDLFGYSVGDRVLYLLIERFASKLGQRELFTRVDADHFVFLVRNENAKAVEQRFAKLVETRDYLADVLPLHYDLTFSVGVYAPGAEESLITMMDKANFARKYAKGSFRNTFVSYNQIMNDEMEWKREVTASMDTALREGKFELFLQPKMLLSEERLVGAEALVRWNSEEHGMLLPTRFIPIFEQNGFVKLLDFYILEQVCIFLKHCITRKEIPPVPISVNFSRAHLGTPDLTRQIAAVLKKHRIPPQLIEIEWSENALLTQTQELCEIAGALRAMGIRVSIDDFGSGSFPLGELKEIPVDIIKIDQKLLCDAAENDKSRLVVTKLIELLKSLRLVTVAEGVETIEQEEMLYRVNCDIAQGYYFAKPLTLDSFRQMAALQLRGNAQEERLIWMEEDDGQAARQESIPQDFEMGNWELHVLGQTIEMGLMKGFLDEDPTIQYINRQALDYLGYTAQEFRDILHNRIAAFIHPDDREETLGRFAQLLETAEPIPFKMRALRKNQEVIWLEGYASCVVDHEQKHIGIYTFRDVTRDENNRALLIQQSEQLETASRRFMELMAGKDTPSFSYRPDNRAIQLHKTDTVFTEDLQNVLNSLTEVGLVAPAYRPMFEKLYSRLEQTQRASVRFQTPATGPSWYELTLLSLPDVDEGYSVQGTIRRVSAL